MPRLVRLQEKTTSTGAHASSRVGRARTSRASGNTLLVSEKGREWSSSRREVIERPFLDDPSILENQKAVGKAQRREPVSGDQDRPPDEHGP